MKSRFVLCFFLVLPFAVAQAQSTNSPDDQVHVQPRKMPRELPEKAQPKGESSSKDSQINPEGARPTVGDGSDVHELLPYDPHKAAKDIEVGQFYLKRKNYRAALDRFDEALHYKPRDAEATYYLAVTQENMALFTQAYQNYRNYLGIYASGPFARQCEEAIRRLEPKVADTPQGQRSAEFLHLMEEGEAALAKNDFEQAHESFTRAAQITPGDAMANYRIGESLTGLHRMDEARIFYKKYLQLDPNGKMAAEAKRQINDINAVLGK